MRAALVGQLEAQTIEVHSSVAIAAAAAVGGGDG